MTAKLSPIWTPWIPLAKQLSEVESGLRPIIADLGPPRLAPLKGDFEALARMIVGQQLHGKAAAAVFGRLQDSCKGAFTPASVLKLRMPKMRAAGLSQAKANAVRSLAERFADRQWRKGWNELSDVDLEARLTEVKGVGPWTAHMFLMFQLRRADIFAPGDFGLRAAIGLLDGGTMPSPKAAEERAARWTGYRTIASWYLWRFLDSERLRLREEKKK